MLNCYCVLTDLSKNRFGEIPPEVCEYTSMESLNCYYNVIKSIPEAITQLQLLTHLNLRSVLGWETPELFHFTVIICWSGKKIAKKYTPDLSGKRDLGSTSHTLCSVNHSHSWHLSLCPPDWKSVLAPH